jgi:membrane-bound lytic murein transglycosylase D
MVLKHPLAILRLLLVSFAVFLSGCSSVLQQDVYVGGKTVSPEFKSFVGNIYDADPTPRRVYPRFSMVINPEVTKQIKHFSDNQRSFVIKAYNNRQRYITEVSELFKREGVPLELINVAAVESAFDTKAHSYKGASGIWQFMKPTARSYDLTVNLFRDERRDPVKSSWAAARHLGDLYDEFGDWNLALAAYNAGGGSVRKAIRKGNSRDFWKLARSGQFRRQTVDYVPRVIAMSIIMKELNEYGFVEVAGLLQNQSVMLSYNQ